MRTRDVLLATGLVALLTLMLAPAALGTSVTVRAEGAGDRVIPDTTVQLAATGGPVSDTAGHTYSSTQATPLNALFWAVQRNGVPWDFGVASFGVFLNSIDGLAMDPNTFADWWEFTVNGFAPPIGLAGLPSQQGDSYVLFQNPDSSYPPRNAQLLAVKLTPGIGLTPGRQLNVSVVGDDLSKADSAADAARFGATDVETPAQFLPVDGATLHVGSRVYALTGSSAIVNGLAPGTYAIWAEKAMDTGWVYVRSGRTRVNVGAAPVLSGLSTSNAKFRRGHLLRVAFHLSSSARVRMVVTNPSGTQLYARTVSRAAGNGSMTWDGNTTLRLGKRLTVTLTATDSWGRASSPARLRIPVGV